MILYFHYSVTRKVAQYLGEVLDDQRDKLQENLLANGGKVSLRIYINFCLTIFMID